MNKNKYLQHLISNEDKYLALRILDKIEGVLKDYKIGYSDFLDPYQISVSISILNRFRDICYFSYGIFEEAERRVIAISPSYMEINYDEFPIEAIKIVGDFTAAEISHRDILGSILSLGIKRQKIGDIYTGDGYVYIIAFSDIIEYLSLYLEKVAKFRVTAKKVDPMEVNKIQENYKHISSTVPSLRLDVVLSVGFGETRSAISKRIKNDRVKVNWKPVNTSSHIINVGDIISFKGMGRIQLVEINGKSRKDRIKITVKKFL